MVHFQKENLKYLESTNFSGCGTTENEIYAKFCFRKSVLENNSIVHKYLSKPGRLCQDICWRGHRRLKRTTGVFFSCYYDNQLDVQ